MTTSQHKFFLDCAGCGERLASHEMSLIEIQMLNLAPGEVARKAMIAQLKRKRELYVFHDCPVCASCSDAVKTSAKITMAVTSHLRELGDNDTSIEKLEQLKLVCSGVLSVLEDEPTDSDVGHAVEALRQVLGDE